MHPDDGQQSFANVNGTSLFYELSGEGRPVAFIHGFTLDHRAWEPQMDALRPTHRVLRYDERGFGQSAEPTEAYSHADDLAALLDYVGTPRADVVGLSIGTMHALELALSYPERVRSLVLVGPAGLGAIDFPPEVSQMFARIRQAAETDGIDAAKRVWRAGGWFAPALENPKAATALDTMLASYSGWHWQNSNPVRAVSPPIHTRLAEITCPTLVIVGERDLPYDHQITDILCESVPDCRRSVIAGAGHLPNLEAPEAFNEALVRFIASVQ
jgi:pimeloyl-ACP methyl ester carboxylesterase